MDKMNPRGKLDFSKIPLVSQIQDKVDKSKQLINFNSQAQSTNGMVSTGVGTNAVEWDNPEGYKNGKHFETQV